MLFFPFDDSSLQVNSLESSRIEERSDSSTSHTAPAVDEIGLFPAQLAHRCFQIRHRDMMRIGNARNRPFGISTHVYDFELGICSILGYQFDCCLYRDAHLYQMIIMILLTATGLQRLVCCPFFLRFIAGIFRCLWFVLKVAYKEIKLLIGIRNTTKDVFLIILTFKKFHLLSQFINGILKFYREMIGWLQQEAKMNTFPIVSLQWQAEKMSCWVRMFCRLPL